MIVLLLHEEYNLSSSNILVVFANPFLIVNFFPRKSFFCFKYFGEGVLKGGGTQQRTVMV